MMIDDQPVPTQEPIEVADKAAIETTSTMAKPSLDDIPPAPEATSGTNLHSSDEEGAKDTGPRDEAADHALFESYLAGMSAADESDGDGKFKKLTRGERVEATVIQVDKDRLFVDLGTKSEGIVPAHELTDSSEPIDELFKVGDKIKVVVLRPEGSDGNAIVSKKRADFEAAWDKVEDALKSGETISAQVLDRVKGGLVVDVGVRGFVPATHVGNGKIRNLDRYVGQPLALKVIEIDRERKKVVLSNRQAEEEKRSAARDEIFTRVTPGAILDGTIRRLTDYGAFVDLGGVDGLLHISEMSWMRINHPREVFKEGQEIKVMVLRLDPDAGKISLGHRQVLPDPWNLIRQNYRIGQKLEVVVGRTVASGAFVKLPEGAEAFLPISEMSNRRIKRPEEALNVGETAEVQIIDLRPDERRMVLSLRAAGTASGVERTGREAEPASFDSDEAGDKRRGGAGAKKGKKGGRGGGRPGRDDDDFEEASGRRGFATGGATIGERLGLLKGLLRGELEEDIDDDVEPMVEKEAEPEASS